MCGPGFALTAAEPLSFPRDIRPILSDKCFSCHGPDARHREADLRLDVEEAAKEWVIVPGRAEDSELIARITSTDPDVRMPPPSSKLSLTAGEIETLRSWIAAGATWDVHWSFAPLPESVAVPAVSRPAWPRNEIDCFVLAALDRAGLSPSAEADRETLIRRWTFDLTGLPPTLAEIDAFLADPSPDAAERVVDRLLASEHFGERLASEWLDVARYSDSYGYQVDRDRDVWPWRDWVVRAFNQNLSYDKFITQQLAGDLLPDADDESLLATTFCRLHPQECEGGSVPEEYRLEHVADRTQTFGTAFLGVTLECCRCHEHKFDPLTQREYYELSAFFANIDEAGLYSYFTPAVPTPTLLLVDEASRRQQDAAAEEVRRAERRVAGLAASRAAAFEDWLQNRRSAEPSAPQDLSELIPGQLAHLDFEQPASPPNTPVPGRVGQAVRLTGDDGVPLEVGNFDRFEPFTVALWLKVPGHFERAVVYHRSRAWTDAASRGYELLIEEGRLSAALIHFWPGNAIRVQTREALRAAEWVHVAVVWDGSGRAEGLQISVDGKPAPSDVVRDQLTKTITGGGGDSITIGERFRDRGLTGGQVDEFQVFGRALTPLEVAQLSDGRSLSAALGTPPDELPPNTRESLRAYYLSAVDDVSRSSLSALREARAVSCRVADAIPEIMVMRELPQPRPTFVLERGVYSAPRDPVTAGSPGIFPPFPDDEPRNRLGLARWLTLPEHPLTARVTVNRYWQMLFGAGLVRTPEDFGSQGEPPSHPELLDWLSRDFVARGWDLKRLLRQIVLSATYRQSSTLTRDLMVRDPENRWLARAPSFRWSAEMLRDNALAVSGLLVDRLGGPPVRPYEVEVSFKPVPRDKGEGLYRRSLYTYWNRTGPSPVMLTFDANKRDVCQVRRERTSSALQALVLLNGPQFVEAARVLGHRLLARHGEDPPAVLTDMFRLLTSRHPQAAELEILQQLLDERFRYFEAHPDAAEAYLSVGDTPRPSETPLPLLAAVATVANTLMSFDECVTRR